MEAAEVPEDNIALFSHDIDVEVLYQFMGHVSDIEDNEGEEVSFVDDSIVKLERLHALHPTMVSCLGDEGPNTVYGHHEKVYHEAFADALAKPCR